jgi:hypothetical protein
MLRHPRRSAGPRRRAPGQVTRVRRNRDLDRRRSDIGIGYAVQIQGHDRQPSAQGLEERRAEGLAQRCRTEHIGQHPTRRKPVNQTPQLKRASTISNQAL